MQIRWNTTNSGKYINIDAVDVVGSLVSAPPTITSLSPTSGSTAGGTSVVIRGTGFTDIFGAAAVTFGGVNATSYTVNSATQITAVAPAHAAETVQVRVTTGGGRRPTPPQMTTPTDSVPTRYEQIDGHLAYVGNWAPYSTGSASGSSYGRANATDSSVTIYFTGTRLDWIAMKGTTTGIADVYLDSVKVATINLANPAGALYKVNVWSTGTIANSAHNVRIVRNTGSAAGKYITIDAVDVVGTLTSAPPTITSLSPTSGSTAGGTSVVIRGTGFTDITGAAAVTFGGVNATSYTVNSATQITAVAPAHAAESVQVRVTTGGGSTTDTTADNYTYVTPGTTPTRYEQIDGHLAYVGNWAPYSTGSASGSSYGRANATDSSVTIYFTGTRLDWIAMKGTTTGIADVYLDSVKVATINLANPAGALYKVNVWSTGTIANSAHNVRIVRNTGSAAGKYITIDAVDVVGTLTSAPPTITSLSPTSGSTAGGTSVVIRGTGFTDITGAAAVTFGGVNATSYTVNSATQITAVAPAHAAETVQVRVTTGGGSTADTTADNYTYVTPGTTPTRYEQTDGHLAYVGNWAPYSTGSASGSSYGRANATDSSVTIYFTGTRLDWIAMKGTTTGIADVYLDSVKVATINLANPAGALYKVNVWSTGTIANSAHNVRIVRNTGSAAGKYITIDAVDVVGTLTSAP